MVARPLIPKGAAATPRLPPPDQVQCYGTISPRTQIDMPRLGAELRQIDRSHRICRPHTQNLPGRHRQQPLARPQNRQRAQQAHAINLDITLHPAAIPSPDKAFHP